MNQNTSDYFAYKKGKIKAQSKVQKKHQSKFQFILQMFFITFIVAFLIMVIAIMKYSLKVDIEYTKGELSMRNTESQNTISGYGSIIEDEPRKIDKRLHLIQQEENAPSEARIIKKEKHNITNEVIDPSLLEENRKIEKIEKQKQKNIQKEAVKVTLSQQDASEKSNNTQQSKKQQANELDDTIENVTVMSKVLIGRCASFEEAQALQVEIKANISTSSPFVRKVGEVYSVQMGSYQDFAVAKSKAQTLKAKGYDVWIYQQ